MISHNVYARASPVVSLPLLLSVGVAFRIEVVAACVVHIPPGFSILVLYKYFCRRLYLSILPLQPFSSPVLAFLLE